LLLYTAQNGRRSTPAEQAFPELLDARDNGIEAGNFAGEPPLHGRFHELLSRAGLRVVDFRSRFKALGLTLADVTFDDMGDLNPRGHALVAEILEREIATEYRSKTVAVAGKTWSRRSGLNRGPADYESAALPLSYAGVGRSRFRRNRQTRIVAEGGSPLNERQHRREQRAITDTLGATPVRRQGLMRAVAEDIVLCRTPSLTLNKCWVGSPEPTVYRVQIQMGHKI
jgi:hypothetical protein